MPNAFGPRKPLFGPYFYRVKQNSNGDTLLAVYVGSKRIAHMDAYWMYSMRSVEDREEEVKQRGRGVSCATDLRALGAEGKYPNVLGVSHAFITDDAHKGKGVGRAMYEAMMAEGFAVRETRIGGKPGPMFFIPDECSGAGNTSAEARRVWASLVRDYPSAGTSIRVDAPPVIGSRAPRSNPRRSNPEPARALSDLQVRINKRLADYKAEEWGIPAGWANGEQDLRDAEAFLAWAKTAPATFRVYRALRLRYPSDLQTEGIGTYWAWSRSGADAYQDDTSGLREPVRAGEGSLYIVVGEVSTQHVDWGRTFFKNLYDAPWEHEVEIRDGAPIRLVGMFRTEEQPYPLPRWRDSTVNYLHAPVVARANPRRRR
jgi:hypothetical protein